MHEQYKEFEEKLNKNEFLRKHYECMPFIGEKYRESGLLLRNHKDDNKNGNSSR